MAEIDCLVIGDPHYRDSNTIESKVMNTNLINLVKEMRPDFVVDLGDTLHDFRRAYIEPFNDACDMINAISDICEIFIIIGNHDISNTASSVDNYQHFFKPYYKVRNVTIVDRPIERIISGNRFVFSPYIYPGKFIETLEKYISNPLIGTRAIFCHQDIEDPSLGALVPDNSDKWHSNYPFGISGHIHKYIQVKFNFVYVGTPRQLNSNDDTDKKVMLAKFTPNVFQPEMTRYDLNLTRKICLVVDCSDLERLVLPQLNGDNEVQIILRGTAQEIASTMKLTKIEELKNKGIRIINKTLINEITSNITLSGQTEFEAQSFKTILEQNVAYDEHLTNTLKRILNDPF